MLTVSRLTLVVVGTLLVAAAVYGAGSEEEALIYLENLEDRLSKAHNLEKVAAWNYVTNVTEETQALSVRDFLILFVCHGMV